MAMSASAPAAHWHSSGSRRTKKGEGRAGPRLPPAAEDVCSSEWELFENELQASELERSTLIIRCFERLLSRLQRRASPSEGRPQEQKKNSCGSVKRGGQREGERNMDTCAYALELLGMLVYVGAWLCALTTTVLPQWLTMSTALLPVESYELGLWETCVVQDIGGMECRAYDSLLGLSTDLKLARILMCAALAVGMLGILVGIPGLDLVHSCKEDSGQHTKRILIIAGGVLGMVSGVLCLIPVSYMAHIAVMHFFDEKVPDVVPRWEFGDALYCGWAAGFLLIAAGLILVTSCSCSQAEPQPVLQRRYQVMGTGVNYRKRTEYV